MRLLETMRAEGGRVALLDRHLARLAASAEAFGYAFDGSSVHAAVAGALGAVVPEGVHRVRLTLGPAGDARAEAARLDGATFRTVWLCPDPLLEVGGPLCVHKTTERAHYERPYRMALARGADEAVLVNARGEVVEGTRTSVWVETGGRMLTPPRVAGGLPGIARAVLLETLPNAAEASLTPADLRAADALYLSNAVRGLVRVRLLGGDESGWAGAEYGPSPLPNTS